MIARLYITQILLTQTLNVLEQYNMLRNEHILGRGPQPIVLPLRVAIKKKKINVSRIKNIYYTKAASLKSNKHIQLLYDEQKRLNQIYLKYIII